MQARIAELEHNASVAAQAVLVAAEEAAAEAAEGEEADAALLSEEEAEQLQLNLKVDTALKEGLLLGEEEKEEQLTKA